MQLWAPASCRCRGLTGNVGVTRQSAGDILGTSVETQLQWPLEPPPNTSTCVLRHLMEHFKARESWEGTSCHKETVQHCRSPQGFLGSLLVPSLCRDTTQRVDLSLPISSPSLTFCRWQMMELPGRSSSCLLAKPAVPPSGNLAFLPQEMCFVSALTPSSMARVSLPYSMGSVPAPRKSREER